MGTGPKPARLAGGDDDLAQRRPGLGEDERALAQVREGDLARSGQRVLRRDHRPQRLVGGREDVEPGGRAGGADRRQRDVDRTPLGERDRLGLRAVAQCDPDPGVLGVKARELLQQALRVGRGGRDAHEAADEAGVLVHVGPGPRRLAEDRLGTA